MSTGTDQEAGEVMTVIPFAPRAAALRRLREAPTPTPVEASFAAPAGGQGRFTGAYRLERCVHHPDGLEAVGVFTGRLDDADGRSLAVATRRQRTRATAVRAGTHWWVALEPVRVDLAGFLLAFEGVAVLLDGGAQPERPAGVRMSAGPP